MGRSQNCWTYSGDAHSAYQQMIGLHHEAESITRKRGRQA